MEEEGQNKFDRDSEFSGGSRRNGGRKVCFTILFCFNFNPSKSFGGMEVEGENKFDRDSKFSGGSRRNGGRQVCFFHYFVLCQPQNLSEEWR